MRSFVSSRALVASQVAVLMLAGCGGGGDTTQADSTPPTLVSVTPPDTSTGVAVSASLSATFSEPLACATVIAASFFVTGDGTLAGSLACAGATVTFTPAVPLQRGRLHSARITTAVTDLAGNHLASEVHWVFTTIPADTTPPTVLSTVPATGATGVSVTTEIRANLSEPVNCDTATGATFTLAAEGPIAGLVGCQGAVVTFSPFAGLQPSTTYTATLTTGLKDVTGNALATPYVYTFTTGVPPDVAQPTIATMSPAAGAGGVPLDAVVTATFSEAMDPATLTATSFTLRAGAAAVAGSVGYAGLTATFTPLAPLAPATLYTVAITVAASDLAGNPLAAPAGWTFTTADAPGGVRLLYQRNSDLFSVREDGTGRVQLTSTAAAEQFEGVGPGGRVVFSRESTSLHAVGADGSSPTALASGLASNAFRGFSTAGRLLYGASTFLHAVGLDGTGDVTLAGPSDSAYSLLHAPAGRVVTMVQTGANRTVLAIDDDGTDAATLDATPGIKMLAAVGPGGRVYYLRYDQTGVGTDADVWAVDLDGANQAPVANHATRYEGLRAIAPDGTLLVDYCDMLEACSDEHLVVGASDLNLGRGSLVGVTPGNQVVYSSGQIGTWIIRAIPTSGAGGVTLAGDGIQNVIPLGLHPDGRVLYRTFDGTQSDLHAVTTVGTGDVLLAGDALKDELLLGIASNGRVVYGTVLPSGNVGSLHSVEADGSGHQLLVDAPDGLGFSGFSSSGKVIFTRVTGGQQELYVVDHDGSLPIGLTGSPTSGFLTFFSSVP